MAYRLKSSIAIRFKDKRELIGKVDQSKPASMKRLQSTKLPRPPFGTVNENVARNMSQP
jgi:hypothetical protein